HTQAPLPTPLAHRIAAYLRMARSTVEAVLRRYQMPLLRDLDQASGLPVRRPRPRRYEHPEPGHLVQLGTQKVTPARRPRPRHYEPPEPGDLVHLDIKKLGRIPDGGGHRKLGRQAGRRNRTGVGYGYLHHAVDDHSRLAYSENLDDERKDTAAEFWRRANAFFADHGIIVKRVLTDNGNCYRSKTFADALGDQIIHKRTRPYRPQTNGKVERLNPTLAPEWASAQPYRSETDRAAPTRTGCITTITTDPTPASAERHPSSAYVFTTCP